jgi:hypothetical protein
MRWIVFLCAVYGAAQGPPGGSEPKAKAADYPVHAAAGTLEIGAEYMVHSFSGRGQTFVTGKYLVVEVALFPHGKTIGLQQSFFSLRLNGKKQTIAPQAPGFVAASLKYPDWDNQRRLEGYGGMGDTGVILGRPAPAERFPGDPNARSRLPNPPRAPEPDQRSGIDKPDQPTADQVALETALPEGSFKTPASGFLYFPYSGKTKSIKSLELRYAGPEGGATLRLR